jgi:hypothetical protein
VFASYLIAVVVTTALTQRALSPDAPRALSPTPLSPRAQSPPPPVPGGVRAPTPRTGDASTTQSARDTPAQPLVPLVRDDRVCLRCTCDVDHAG